MERNIFDDLAAQSGQQQIQQPVLEHIPENQPQDDQINAENQPYDVNGQFTSEQQPPEEPVVNTKPTPQQSFQEMRLKNEQLQRERDEAYRVLQYIEQYNRNQKTEMVPEVKQVESYVPDYSDDDIVEGRHLKNEIASLKQELQKNRMEQEKWLQEQRNQSIELQLKSKYNDFDKVVTYENCVKLRELKPEIANTLNQSSDIYNKAAATYTLLKELGIYQGDRQNPDVERVQHNSVKPRPVASVAPQRSDSNLSYASSFSRSMSEAEKRKTYAQMVANSKNR